MIRPSLGDDGGQNNPWFIKALFLREGLALGGG